MLLTKKKFYKIKNQRDKQKKYNKKKRKEKEEMVEF